MVITNIILQIIKGAGIFLLLILSQFSFGQEGQLNHQEIFKPRTQLLLSSSANLYNTLDIQNTGADWLESSGAFGGTIGFGVSQILFGNLSLIIGGDITVIGHNFNYEFNSPVSNPQIENVEQDLIHFDYHAFTSWNFGLSYYLDTYIINDKFRPIVSVGMKRNRMLSYEFEVSSGYFVNNNEPTVDIFIMNLTDYENTTESDFSFMSYYVKLGLLKQQKKLNTMQLNLLYHYAADKIGKGSYQFSNLGQESSGDLELGANYVGIEFIYGFTFFKPRE